MFSTMQLAAVTPATEAVRIYNDLLSLWLFRNCRYCQLSTIAAAYDDGDILTPTWGCLWGLGICNAAVDLLAAAAAAGVSSYWPTVNRQVLLFLISVRLLRLHLQSLVIPAGFIKLGFFSFWSFHFFFLSFLFFYQSLLLTFSTLISH